MAEMSPCPICEEMLNLEIDVIRSHNMSTCKKCRYPINATVNPRNEDIIQAYKEAAIS